jgi:penicillin-binding protein 1A
VTRKHPGRKPARVFIVIRLIGAFFMVVLAGLGLGGFLLYRILEPQLPDIEVLSEVRYQIPMSVFTKDRLLMAHFGEKKSSPIDIKNVPSRVTQAFLAAEDNRFFEHPGVDYQGLMRATFSFLRTGEKKQGGSTITMQVARNFFLSSEKTLLRKIKEILLSIKIESRLPKERILELYLNKIYFGHHAYGVVAAAQVYYGKSVAELDLAEIAMIAGLPKAPSAFNPIVNPERALSRRNYVLKRMHKLGFINDREYGAALARPVTARLHTASVEFPAPYLAELVRNEMYQQLGESAYTNGYRVYTTIDGHLQTLAEKTLRTALHSYDERHGYRPPSPKHRLDLKKIKTPAEWDQPLSTEVPIGDTVPGLVVSVREASADVYLGAGQTVQVDWSGLKWARKFLNENAVGAYPRSAREVVKPGDLVRLRRRADGPWMLSQIPDVAGALVALDSRTGAIVALAGGYDFALSKFNRGVQAQRQPGSGFKPVLYAAALEEGYTPASVVNDAPIVYADPSQAGGVWRPQNYSGRFYGPTRLRVALAKSRNLVSVRLLKSIGLKKAIDTALQFGFKPEELPKALPLALGSGTATPLRMAQVYSVFANGGFRVEPYLIDRIETEGGRIIYQATPQTACPECPETGTPPENQAPRAISPQVHYMMHSMLQDVIRKGTATQALELGRSDLAGKTGTTNEYRDAWFNGYAPGSLAAVAWMGFDSYRPLGKDETGGHAALPMWIDFMREALKDVPEYSFPLPSGLTTVRVEGGGSKTAAAFEVYPTGHAPRNLTERRRRPRTTDSAGPSPDGQMPAAVQESLF